MRTRHTFVATGMVALLALAGVTAAIAADPADPPPPRIAFVANGRVPADALAAGPIAGQLGAPVYTTEQHVLPDSSADALDDYNPELVIVMGGSVAISDDVVNAIAAATGLPVVDPTPPPTTGVVRAAGEDRFVTATVVADLLSAYDPAYLGVDLQAVDADLLDGKDSSAFLGKTEKATDSNKLDGQDRDQVETLVFTDVAPYAPGPAGLGNFDPAEVRQFEIDVPVAGTLTVDVEGSFRYNGADTAFYIFGTVDTDCTFTAEKMAGSGFGHVSSTAEFDEASGLAVAAVGAGTHTVRLCGAYEFGDPQALSSVVLATFFPDGGAAASSLSSGEPRSVDPGSAWED